MIAMNAMNNEPLWRAADLLCRPGERRSRSAGLQAGIINPTSELSFSFCARVCAIMGSIRSPPAWKREIAGFFFPLRTEFFLFRDLFIDFSHKLINEGNSLTIGV
uniref:Uncharacterized protein n=1 Tax=Candidatus Kentrum sp. FM TaxID=2126340 RepID=A0A450W5K4_9GAMM|nr:MAG: hypothetical protein BECKFM1743A_GA0114220_102422 [Candidatus Kentron sp. FM]VFJ61703.1 MAG: hypothetical protein BECKFM1743C_GA0114222_102987 [Candidatus Kentron sp. FM]VFK12333.1 MAG: hypothetical protein BECKFM1743B_GA0114221_102362 [Candidatus Kentron sp. FM]